MGRKLIPLAIAYDFDGTLAPGNMQEHEFIPTVRTTTKAFWDEVKSRSEEQNADNILIYMNLMLQKADAAEVEVRRANFVDFGAGLRVRLESHEARPRRRTRSMTEAA